MFATIQESLSSGSLQASGKEGHKQKTQKYIKGRVE